SAYGYRTGAQLLRRYRCARELEGEGHRVASGMRGGDQLLGVRACATVLVFEAQLRRIRRVVQHAARRGERAAAILAAAAPDRLSLPLHSSSSHVTGNGP